MSRRKTVSKSDAKNIDPRQFLPNIRTALLNNPSLDKDLTKILNKHILTGNPKEDAVDNAVEAINKLIEDRAVAAVNEKYRKGKL